VITATDIAANKLRFNPAANENGSSYTTFNFTVNDGDADSATPNTITVNVTAVNDAPVADDETGAVNEDATLTVTDGTSDVLHGDTDVDSGDTLVATTYSHTSAKCIIRKWKQWYCWKWSCCRLLWYINFSSRWNLYVCSRSKCCRRFRCK